MKKGGQGPERIPDLDKGDARDKAAAEIVGVNPRYVSDAKKLKEEAQLPPTTSRSSMSASHRSTSYFWTA